MSNTDDDYRIVERIAKYSEEVNGFSATSENILYWKFLPRSKKLSVLRKWRGLALEQRKRNAETSK